MQNRDWVCFDDKVKTQAQKERRIEEQMQEALQTGCFQMYLQPQYQISDDSVSGAEALVRWQQPDGSMMPPNDFIPIFEKNGFVLKLDYEMFRQACETLRCWLDANIPAVPIAVNFSRLHLENPHFVSDLCAIAEEYAVPHQLLEIELTESAVMEHAEALKTAERELHAVGMRLSIDDFGAGYSSLGVLKSFQFDTLKLDRSFFTDQDDPQRAQAVIASVILMAHSLSILTIAEGIEECNQVELLKKLQCDVVQDYYYARPMKIEDVAALLRENNGSVALTH